MASDVAGRDIDVVLVAGAGASCSFGVNNTTLPLMDDWSADLVQRLAAKDPAYLSATGLEMGLEGEEFERRLGRFLRSVEAFTQIEPLLGPLSLLPSAEPVRLPEAQWEAWHHTGAFNLAQVINVIHDSLYALFGAKAWDPGAAQQGYGGLFGELGIRWPSSRFVYATTNYDTIGEDAIAALGGIPDVGDVQSSPFSAERPIRVERLLDGMPRYTPVLHLHGRVGWFRRRDGSTVSTPLRMYDPQTGVPIVMLPDLEKDYGTDAIISTLWAQFAEALSRAKHVLVLGHSLHDELLVRTLTENVFPPAKLAVTVLPSTEGVDARDALERLTALLPDAVAIPLRFDAAIARNPTGVREWAFNS